MMAKRSVDGKSEESERGNTGISTVQRKRKDIEEWCNIVSKLPISWHEREKEWMPLIERALKVHLAGITKHVKELSTTTKHTPMFTTGYNCCKQEVLIILKEMIENDT